MYSKDGCGYCDKIKGILKDHNINHKVLDLDQDYSLEEVKLRVSRAIYEPVERLTFPVIFDESLYVGGCDDMMDYMLEKAMV